MSAALTVVTVYGSRFYRGAGADPKCRFGADVSTATLVDPGGTAMPYLECSVGPATSGVAVRPLPPTAPPLLQLESLLIRRARLSILIRRARLRSSSRSPSTASPSRGTTPSSSPPPPRPPFPVLTGQVSSLPSY